MATTPKRGLPTVFVTKLTGLCSGENQCLWAPWFAARFKYDKYEDGGFDSAAWSADHDALVAKRVKEFVPNKHPDAPAGAMQKVKFDNAQPQSKGYKRDPTPSERKALD